MNMVPTGTGLCNRVKIELTLNIFLLADPIGQERITGRSQKRIRNFANK
jgi:hypothetical protein